MEITLADKWNKLKSLISRHNLEKELFIPLINHVDSTVNRNPEDFTAYEVINKLFSAFETKLEKLTTGIETLDLPLKKKLLQHLKLIAHQLNVEIKHSEGNHYKVNFKTEDCISLFENEEIFKKRYFTRDELRQLIPESYSMRDFTVIYFCMDHSSIGFVTSFSLHCFFELYNTYSECLKVAFHPNFRGDMDETSIKKWMLQNNKNTAISISDSSPGFFKLYRKSVQNGKPVFEKGLIVRDEFGFKLERNGLTAQSVLELLLAYNPDIFN